MGEWGQRKKGTGGGGVETSTSRAGGGGGLVVSSIRCIDQHPPKLMDMVPLTTTHPLTGGLDDAHGIHSVAHAQAEARHEDIPVLEPLLGLQVRAVCGKRERQTKQPPHAHSIVACTNGPLSIVPRGIACR